MADSTTPNRDDIRSDMERLGITQQVIANALGKGRSTITLWLAGEFSSPALDSAIPAYIRGVADTKEAATKAA